MNMTVQPIAAPSGSAERPSIHFGPDSGSGFYRAGTNSVGVAIDGAGMLTVDADGLNVGGDVAAGGDLSGTSVSSSGAMKSSSQTQGIGYGTGAGGAVTQITSRVTGVTLNKACGTITGDPTSLAAGATATFTVTNSAVTIRDVVALSVVSGPTANTSMFCVSAVRAGSFDITARNLNATTADTGAPIINFAVIKAVAA